MNRLATEQEGVEFARRAHAAILADALSNGRRLYDSGANAFARDVVTKSIVDLRRMSGATPEVMVGTLIDAARTCQDADWRRAQY